MVHFELGLKCLRVLVQILLGSDQVLNPAGNQQSSGSVENLFDGRGGDVASYSSLLLVLLTVLAGVPAAHVADAMNTSALNQVLSDFDHSVKRTPGVSTSGFWNSTHHLGLLPSTAPLNETAKESVGVQSPGVPNSFSWNDYFGGPNYMTLVKNQGGCGSCWDFASIGAMEAQYQIGVEDNNAGVDLSEQNVLSCSGGSCSGWYIDETLSYLRESGTPDEGCNPYTGTDSPCGSGRCSDYVSRTYYITGWSRIPTDTATIKDYLYNHGPVIVAFALFCSNLLCTSVDFPWGDATFWQYHFFAHAPSGPYGYEGHAVVIVGWDDQEPGTADDYWIVRNSWGTSGGDVNSGYGGYFYMTQDATTGFFGVYNEAYSISGVTAPLHTVTFYTDPSSATITVDGVAETSGATGTYSDGQRVHVVAEAPSGYSFATWGVSGVSVDDSSSSDTYMTVLADGWLKAYSSPQVSMVSSVIFPAAAGSEYFIGHTNPYDNQALLGLWAKASSSQDIGPWTRGGWVDQATGRPLVAGNLVLVAGPVANKVVNYYQSQGLSVGFRWASVSGVSYAQVIYRGQVLAQMRENEIGSGKDVFVVQTIHDGDGRLVLMLWGIGAQGTLASGVWFVSNFSTLGSLTDSIYIYSWTDTNGDKFPEPGEITLAYQGN